MATTYNLGSVSSYAIARQYGFTGTEEEWVQAIINASGNYDDVKDMVEALEGQIPLLDSTMTYNDRAANAYAVGERLTALEEPLTEERLSDELKLKTIKDYVTPEMFGAKGDGVTDDTEAIQNMFDYVYNSWINEKTPNLVNNQKPTGLKVVFTDGKYNFTNVTVLNYNADISGSGVLLGTLTIGGNEIKWYDFNINGLTFKGSNSGIILSNARRGIIQNCKFFNCTNAIYLPQQNTDYTQATYQITIKNCYAIDITHFLYSQTTGHEIAEIYITGSIIWLSDSGNAINVPYIDGLIFNDNVIIGGEKTIVIGGLPEGTIANNHFFESKDTVLDIEKFQQLCIDNNLFSYPCTANLSPAINLHGYDTSGSAKYNSFVISSNAFLQPSYFGVKLENVGTGTIIGNQFTACGTNPRATISVSNVNAVVLNSCANDILIDNNLHSLSTHVVVSEVTVQSSNYNTTDNPFYLPLYANQINIAGNSSFKIASVGNIRVNMKLIALRVYDTISITDSFSAKSLEKGIHMCMISTDNSVTIIP